MNSQHILDLIKSERWADLGRALDKAELEVGESEDVRSEIWWRAYR